MKQYSRTIKFQAMSQEELDTARRIYDDGTKGMEGAILSFGGYDYQRGPHEITISVPPTAEKMREVDERIDKIGQGLVGNGYRIQISDPYPTMAFIERLSSSLPGSRLFFER